VLKRVGRGKDFLQVLYVAAEDGMMLFLLRQLTKRPSDVGSQHNFLSCVCACVTYRFVSMCVDGSHY